MSGLEPITADDAFDEELLGRLGTHRVQPELKGSIGEGPNHSNFSDRSTVKILAKFRNFRQKIKKIQEISTFSKISAKFR